MSASVLTVSQITTYIKAVLDENIHLRNVYVVGEISNFKPYYRSGHIYFTLKDERSQIKAVMFSAYAQKLRFDAGDGMRVICRGRISLYEKDGAYQLYVEDMQPDGIGALAIAYEQLKGKLEKEGLFDDSHKKPLPKFPKKIGVATSNQGAAIEDIKNIMNRRSPQTELVIVSTSVQGEQAAPDIVKSIRLLDSIEDIDLIIVGRGGGSVEDLWAFNTEAVARAVFECKKPVISAVGHETDFTICDFAADLRAPTPSAAAELAVRDNAQLANFIENAEARLMSMLRSKVDYELQRLDGLINNSPLSSFDEFFMRKADLLDVAAERLSEAYRAYIDKSRDRLYEKTIKLDALSPLKVLARGYCAVSKNGIPIKGTEDIRAGEVLSLAFSDGRAECTVNEVNKNE